MAKKIEQPVLADIEEEQHREFLLSKLRAAGLRAKLIEADIISVGVALKGGMIGVDTAVAWINDQGLWWFVGAIPEQIGRVAQSNPTITQQQETSGDDQ